MSIYELRMRLSDVPESETLVMQTIGRDDVYSIGDKTITLPAGTPISYAETAIRVMMDTSAMPPETSEKPAESVAALEGDDVPSASSNALDEAWNAGNPTFNQKPEI